MGKSQLLEETLGQRLDSLSDRVAYYMDTNPEMSRRQLLKRGTLTGAGLLLAGTVFGLMIDSDSVGGDGLKEPTKKSKPKKKQENKPYKSPKNFELAYSAKFNKFNRGELPVSDVELYVTPDMKYGRFVVKYGSGYFPEAMYRKTERFEFSTNYARSIKGILGGRNRFLLYSEDKSGIFSGEKTYTEKSRHGDAVLREKLPFLETLLDRMEREYSKYHRR